MLKQNVEFKWFNEGKLAFGNIREALAISPTIVQSNVRNPFKMYTYALDYMIS